MKTGPGPAPRPPLVFITAPDAFTGWKLRPTRVPPAPDRPAQGALFHRKCPTISPAMNAVGRAVNTSSDQASTTDAGSTTSRIPRVSSPEGGRIASGSTRIGGTARFPSGEGTEIGSGGGDSTAPAPPEVTAVEMAEAIGG